MKNKIYAHCSYIGTTGYNNHARNFFRHLAKYSKIKVRNFTIGESWKTISDNPHDNEPYLNDLDKSILYEQILLNDKNLLNYKIYKDINKDFSCDVNIILAETNHCLYNDNYKGYKIAYNVWESTKQPTDFFNKLKYYDELWVPSKWQKEFSIKQGYNPDKIKVIPEGVDISEFYYDDKVIKHDLTSDDSFTFFIAGRWEYRKATKEIIETFLKTFNNNENVRLILSVDNVYGDDSLPNSTEDKLELFGFNDDRLKVVHFPERSEYIKLIKSSNVFLSCSRSEGWNIPLIEAMSSGVPSIYSNCSGQLEFAEGKGIPINILGVKSYDNDYLYYYEPDFNDLKIKMKHVYDNYSKYKEKAIIDSIQIRENFNWDKIAKLANDTICDFLKNKNNNKNMLNDKNIININYKEGPKVEIIGNKDAEYYIEFINKKTNDVLYSTTIKNNMWAKSSITYYVPWVIKINNNIVSELNIEDKDVLINLDSKSIGDTIAWAPYAIEFSKNNNCNVLLSTFHNYLFDGLSEYSKIKFIEPNSEIDCSFSYSIGWYYDKNKEPISPPNIIPLQQAASNILGLPYKELHTNISFNKMEAPTTDKYITIAPESTSALKMWDNEQWEKTVEYLINMGYKVYNVSYAGPDIKGAIRINRNSKYGIISEITMNYIYHSELFIGLGSGLSWLAWSLNKHVILIANFSKNGHEFTTNVTRINNTEVCNGCWNNPNFKFDKNDWYWCPIWKNTDRYLECHKSITYDMVIRSILKYFSK